MFRKAQSWKQYFYLFNDFSEILKNCEAIEIANDTANFVPVKNVDSIKFMLNEDLKNLSWYFVENELVVNLKAGRIKCILLGTSRKFLATQNQLFYNHTQIYVAKS